MPPVKIQDLSRQDFNILEELPQERAYYSPMTLLLIALIVEVEMSNTDGRIFSEHLVQMIYNDGGENGLASPGDPRTQHRAARLVEPLLELVRIEQP